MERLVEVVQRRASERAQRFVGRELDVLVEGPSRTDPSRLRGRTRHNKVVNFSGLAQPGEIVAVRDHLGDEPDARRRSVAAVAGALALVASAVEVWDGTRQDRNVDRSIHAKIMRRLRTGRRSAGICHI